MATKEQLFVCHRIMSLCSQLSAQLLGTFNVSYTGVVDSISVHAYEKQEYEGQPLSYLDGWTSADDGNNVYLGNWYELNYGYEGECIDRLCALESKLESLLDRDEDGVPL